MANAEQQALTEEFVKILEEFLGVERTPFSFVEQWEKNPPQAAGGLPLLGYTEKSALCSLCYDYYHGFDSFRDEYSAKFGKKPFFSSVVRFRWQVCNQPSQIILTNKIGMLEKRLPPRSTRHI